MNNFFDTSTGLFGGLGRVWDLLTKPHPSITDFAEQRMARLAASFLFSIAMLDFVGGLARIPRVGVVQAFTGPIGLSFIVLLLAYFLTRTKWYRVAVFLFAVSFSSLAYATMITQGSNVDHGAQVLIYVPISLIVASSFLSAPAVFLLVGLNIGAYLSIQLFGVALPENVGAQAGMITVMGVVLMLLTNFRDSTEKIRLEELRETNRELESLTTGLEQRIKERTQALNNVAEISTVTSSIKNLQKMLENVVHLTQRRFGLYHAHVFLYDEQNDSLNIVACGWKEGDIHEGTHGTTSIPLSQEQSLVARAARTKQPVIVNDVRSDPGWLPNPLLPDTAAELAVPLLVGDEIVGVLDVQSDRTNVFTDADANIQSTLGAQVAIAVQNLRQFENSQKVAKDLSVVAQVGIATSTITNIDHLLQEVVDLSKKSFDLYHAHIYMLDETNQLLKLTAGADEVGRKMVAEGRVIPLDSEKSLVARAARDQQGVLANDVAADPDFLPNPLLPNTHAELAVPLIISNRVIGVLDVQSDIVGRFTEIDSNIMSTLASQIAVAVQNARNFEHSKRQAEREAAVNLISQRIQSTTTVEEALQVATRELGHAMGMKATMLKIEAQATPNKTESVL